MIPLWFFLITLPVMSVLSAALGYWVGWGRRGAHDLLNKIEGQS